MKNIVNACEHTFKKSCKLNLFKVVFCFAVLYSLILLSDNAVYAICNSPYSGSYTVCKGNTCTTYCTPEHVSVYNTVYNPVYYAPAVLTREYPGVSFGWHGKNGSVYYSETYTGYYSPAVLPAYSPIFSISIGANKHHPAMHRKPAPKPIVKPYPAKKPQPGSGTKPGAGKPKPPKKH